MANEFLNPVVISKELLLRWENSTVMAKMVNRDFDDQFGNAGAKIGYTYNVRIPVRFRGRRGDGIKPESINEAVVPVVINQLWGGGDMEISDQDLTLTVDRFGERYLESCASRLANMMDGDLCDLYADVYNLAGLPGVIPADLTTYTDAGVNLSDSGTPPDMMRALVITPRMEAAALGFRANLYNPTNEISQQYLNGKMGRAVGWKWNMDQNIARHTIGVVAGTPLVNGANQSGSNLITNGWTATTSTLKFGDIISVVGMNSCNPVSYRDTGSLRTFTVTADCTADGSGNMTIPVSPDINFDQTSSTQTVMNAPPNAAAIYVWNTAAAQFANITGVVTAAALGFHKEAFALVVVPLELPGGLDWSERVTDPKTGMTARLTRGFDIAGNKRYTRFEALGGVKTVRPEYATRIASA